MTAADIGVTSTTRKADSVDLTVLLTVYKRATLRRQLHAIMGQTVRPERIVIFQNGNYQHVSNRYMAKRGVEVVRNSANTGFFGRFAYLLGAKTRSVAVLDDDIIPGPKFIENYLRQLERFGGIIGGNGRIALSNFYYGELERPPDVGIREEPTLVDFVGHAWFFSKDLLFDMFSFRPFTFTTGEDMHLCFSAKLRSASPSIVAAQPSLAESCDVALNRYAKSGPASFKSTSEETRKSVETYFQSKNLDFITPREQKLFRTG